LNSVELYDGSTLISSRSVTSSGVVVLDNFELPVSRDVIKTLTIKGNFGADATNASTIGVSVTGARYEQPTGSIVPITPTVTGATHYVYTSTAEFALNGTPTVMSQGSNAAGSTTQMQAQFNINVTPKGGSMAIPTVTLVFATSSDRATALANGVTSVASVSATDGSTTLSENSSKTLSVSSTLFYSQVPQSGSYNVFVKDISWSVAGNSVVQSHGFEEFKTNTPAPFNK
jgi:hypothetical protein